MIYTLTFNPSLDYTVDLDEFEIGKINRTVREATYVGGKGINVSMMLKNIGVDSIALGFTGGYTGEKIKGDLKEKGIKTDFIEVKGDSRINVEIRYKEETSINGAGPDITMKDVEKLFLKLKKLQKEDFLILSGSVSKTLPQDIYKTIIEYVKDKGINIVVDATKNLLLSILEYKPFLIKPNNFELEELFDVKLNSKKHIIKYAKILRGKGARNVLVSLAADGAVLIDENDTIYIIDAPKGELKNSIGAGDSMIAGFVAGYLKDHDYKNALKMGVACGSASAFSETLGTKDEVLSLLNAT